MVDDSSSTLKPAQVAQVLVRQATAKHNDRYDKVFIKAFMAGVMLSFGGLLSEVLQGGATGLTASNPGIVRILGGFVFPVGLVMIVLQGQELLTSNMMTFPMAVAKRVIPWWGLPLNWIIVFFWKLDWKSFLRCCPRSLHRNCVGTAIFRVYSEICHHQGRDARMA